MKLQLVLCVVVALTCHGIQAHHHHHHHGHGGHHGHDEVQRVIPVQTVQTVPVQTVQTVPVQTVQTVPVQTVQTVPVTHVYPSHHSHGSMETSYHGKLHERDQHGHEHCIGSFTGTNVFHNHNRDGCWSAFTQRCKEIIGGLMLMLSSSTGRCGCSRPTAVDFDVRSRIVNHQHNDCCCDKSIPVVTQTAYVAEPQTCTEATPVVTVSRPRQIVTVAEPEPITVQQVPVVIEERHHDEGHRHHRHHHHHHRHHDHHSRY